MPKEYLDGSRRSGEAGSLLARRAFRHCQTIGLFHTRAGNVYHVQPIVPLICGKTPTNGGDFYIDEFGNVSEKP